MNHSQAGYRQLNHTADIQLEFWAPTQDLLFAQGALAIVDILTETQHVDSKETRACQCQGLDPEDLLVQWLNEIIFLGIYRGFIVATCNVEIVGNTLQANITGEVSPEKIKTELKSVTYHELLLCYKQPLWHARVVVDV
jgi:SHS2 domain-containing protein